MFVNNVNFSQSYTLAKNDISGKKEASSPSFQGKARISKEFANTTKAYVSQQIKYFGAKAAKVVEQKIAKNGSIVKYLEDGTIEIQGTSKVANPVKSVITKDVTSSKAWKSSHKKESFEQASSYEASRNLMNSGIKKIEGSSKEGRAYINNGYTHEVKIHDDMRLFGKQLSDGSYEWSLFEHSKLH